MKPGRLNLLKNVFITKKGGRRKPRPVLIIQINK